jgi:hypothetical protein
VGLEVYVDPNGIYSYEDAAVMFIPAVHARLNSQSVFLVFDHSDIPRVQSELDRGNKVGQHTDERPFWTKTTAQSTRLWTGKLPKTELNDLILATDLNLSPQGYLDKDSLDIASKLAIGHSATQTVEDEKAYKEDMQVANALYTYAECTLCNCAQCANILEMKRPARSQITGQHPT